MSQVLAKYMKAAAPQFATLLSKLSAAPTAAPTGSEAAKKVEVPQVPVERLVASPRRIKGRGRRDTILTGADALATGAGV